MKTIVGKLVRSELSLILLLMSAGCSRVGDTQETMSQTPVATEDLGSFTLDPSAPTVVETYPALASAGLMHARLMDLPEGVLLRSDTMAIQQADIERELADVPANMRDELRKQSFYVLEQIATRNLLAVEAHAANLPGRDDAARTQALLEREASGIEVTDDEVRAYFESNRGMTGGAPYDQIASQLRFYVQQEKQQKKVNQFIQKLALRTPVAVSATWTAQKAAAATDNPIDHARASGKPTLVSFGADKCLPCRAMAPTREAVAKKYDGLVNVVYIRVDQNQVLSSRYGVRGIPHLVFYDRDGRETFAHTGVMSQDEMEEQFARLGVAP